MCTFWYLETMHFHINCPKTVKMPMASPQGLQEVCHQATKPPAKQPAWCQNGKLASRARPFGITAAFPLPCRDCPKWPKIDNFGTKIP